MHEATTHMRFVDDAFPLLVCIGPPLWDDAAVTAMTEGFEQYFARGVRYAVINHTPRGGGIAGSKERRRIADWANSARVRSISAELCVGSSIVLRDPFARAALAAIQWFWKPTFPYCTTTSPRTAIDWCLGQIHLSALPMPRNDDEVRRLLHPMLDAL